MIRIIFSLLVGVASLTGAAQAAEPVQLADNAPDTYTVKKGDTLWDISGMFLKQPWRWPEVWRMNRDQVRNPHLIYPGQLIVLDRSGPSLGLGRVISDKLQPRIYSEPLGEAITSIPAQAIEPFLTQPLIVEQESIENSATIVATEEGRVYTGRGDTIFAKNVTADHKKWLVYRPTRPLKDPTTKEILAYEAAFLGSAHVTEHGTPATLSLVEANQEIGTGDQMVPAEEPTIMAYVPHPPEGEVNGQVASIYEGVAETGAHNVITLNLGRGAGLEPGHVLALYRNRGAVSYKDKASGAKETFLLPDQRYGLVFVFRVFERVSYALVMNTEGTVKVSDYVRTP